MISSISHHAYTNVVYDIVNIKNHGSITVSGESAVICQENMPVTAAQIRQGKRQNKKLAFAIKRAIIYWSKIHHLEIA